MPSLTVSLFYTCCNVVSRPDARAEEPSWCEDEKLRESLERMKSTLPEDFEWPDRGGLVQALTRGATAWLTNVKVDITSHLADRMAQWIVIWLAGVIGQRGITEKHMWTIADRIVGSLTWDEKKAEKHARSAGESVPAPPDYVKPDDIDGLLGAAVLNKLPALDQETKDHIWELFDETLLPHIGGALPLCPSNFGKAVYDPRYVYLLLYRTRMGLTGCACIDGSPTLLSI